MTSNQIAFAKLQEDVRHNQLTEAQARNELAEAKRHSVVTETEAGRHNTASEMENQRHNVITENEAQRHNTSVESEAHRSNLEQERLKGEAQTEIHRSNLMGERLRQEEVWNEQYKLAETRRHNEAVEWETNRHNLIVEGTVPAETAKLSAEASLTQAKVPGALADATYTNTKSTGQALENRYIPARNESEIFKNWSTVWSNILKGVSTGVGTFGSLPAFSLIQP